MNRLMINVSVSEINLAKIAKADVNRKLREIDILSGKSPPNL